MKDEGGIMAQAETERGTRQGSKRVLLFLAEGFEDCEAVGVLSACRWTEYRPHLPLVAVDIAALHPQVSGRFGTAFEADVLLPDADPAAYDALVVPGGFHDRGFDEAYCDELRRFARQLHGHGGAIATLCVGVLPIAEAGLLEGGSATTFELSRNHDNPGRLEELGCQPAHEGVAEWERIISCSGPAFTDEVARRLLAHLVGPEGAAEVERFRRGLA